MLDNFITHDRARPSSSEISNRTEVFLSDKSRLIYSSAFRRLQQKAQVFSLESNSAVRSRLTHSLEVAHIGRSLVAAVADELLDKYPNEDFGSDWSKELATIMTIVETSCLMHDLGNPPFGHFCESAISTWFNSKECQDSIESSLGNDKIHLELFLDDFYDFDGNPQGFRIATKLQGDDGLTGLNLTYTQLASFIKYVAGSGQRDGKIKFKKKMGYFSTEEEVYKNMCSNLRIPLEARHPFAFLMEAADDISYCISDIEDGIEKRVITEISFFDYFFERFEEIFSACDNNFISEVAALINNTKDNLEKQRKNQELTIKPFLLFKTKLSLLCVKEAACLFALNYREIIDFNYKNPIIDGDLALNRLLDILKEYTRNNVFNSYEAESMEISGYSIVLGILSSYKKLLQLKRDAFKRIIEKRLEKGEHLDIEIRLFNRLPERYVKAYRKAEERASNSREWNLRAHLIVDFIAGMTDQFALETYKMLHGIRL